MAQAVPNHDPAGQSVEAAIQEVIEISKASSIQGKDVTPFILRSVAEKTGGDSLRRYVAPMLSEKMFGTVDHSSSFVTVSNISLVKQNAEVGADIAKSLSNLQLGGSRTSGTVHTPMRKVLPPPESRVVCIGGTVIDTVAKSNQFIAGTSNPGVIHYSGMILVSGLFIYMDVLYLNFLFFSITH